jgi:dethiobiotin synthetase
MLVVDTNSEAEDYVVHELRAKSLPSVAYFVNGKLGRMQELSDLAVTEAAASTIKYEALMQFHAHNKILGPHMPLHRSAELMQTAQIGQLFLSGDRSSVGKSSMCLAMLVTLLKRGIDPSALAYIKPVTQCEAEQPVTQFCNRVGIANRGIGPVVFYKGFTRAFLNGEAGTAESLLQEVQQSVDEIARGKMFVLVDGVGYPSVGSICNLSNADVAKKLSAPVLLIGKTGVGDAVDSYNLNNAYFELKGVRVLGGIFNKLPLDGYYSLEACKEAVSQYFALFRREQSPYGFVPVISALPSTVAVPATDDSNGIIDQASSEADGDAMQVCDSTESANGVARDKYAFAPFEEELSEAFERHVDLDRLLHDIWMHEVRKRISPHCCSRQAYISLMSLSHALQLTKNAREYGSSTVQSMGSVVDAVAPRSHTVTVSPQTATTALTAPVRVPAPFPAFPATAPASISAQGGTTVGVKRTRQEVESEARKQGASGG